MNRNVTSELQMVLARLGPEQREQVLKYAQSLQDHGEFPKRSMLDLVGTISKEDLQIMREVIEEKYRRYEV